jgi:pyruvate,orthophosphate dikinase
MPGMLETVLNVGLTGATTRALLRRTGNPRLVWDTACRFAQAYAETVTGCQAAPFLQARNRVLAAVDAQALDEVDPLTLRDLAYEMADLARVLSGAPLPDDPFDQLHAAVEAVFRSWETPRAAEYRRLSHVDDTTGTAVIVQAMVFGNGHAASGSGVGFTRNPSTGADELYIDFLFNAQGEDVVSGRHRVEQTATLAAALPDIDHQLRQAKAALESEFRDMQDFEFTVEDGELYFLQSRTGKRTPWAALRIATDLVRAGLVTPDEASRRLRAYDLQSIQRTRLVLDSGPKVVGSAVPAAMGVAVGVIALDRDRAQALAATQPVVLVRTDLTTDDVAALALSAGIVTAHGGRTSHAAVVARQLGKVCLVGCSSLHIDETRRRCSFGETSFAEGEVITLDGESGLVYAGAVPTLSERPETALAEVEQWRTTGGKSQTRN